MSQSTNKQGNNLILKMVLVFLGEAQLVIIYAGG